VSVVSVHDAVFLAVMTFAGGAAAGFAGFGVMLWLAGRADDREQQRRAAQGPEDGDVPEDEAEAPDGRLRWLPAPGAALAAIVAAAAVTVAVAAWRRGR
jgi:hypothetical protein